MCMAKIRGGQRCFGHAMQAFNKALTQQYIIGQSEHGSERWQAARAKVEAAGVQLASTTDGIKHLRVLAAVQANLDRPEQAGWFDSMARRGESVREANAAIKKATDDRAKAKAHHRRFQTVDGGLG